MGHLGAVVVEIVGGVLEIGIWIGIEIPVGRLGGCGVIQRSCEGLPVRWIQNAQSKEDSQTPCRVSSPQWAWVEVEGGLLRLRVHEG